MTRAQFKKNQGWCRNLLWHRNNNPYWQNAASNRWLKLSDKIEEPLKSVLLNNIFKYTPKIITHEDLISNNHFCTF